MRSKQIAVVFSQHEVTSATCPEDYGKKKTKFAHFFVILTDEVIINLSHAIGVEASLKKKKTNPDNLYEKN